VANESIALVFAGLVLLAGLGSFVVVLAWNALKPRRRAVQAAPSGSRDEGFGASFRTLDALADDAAYQRLGEAYVANRATRKAAEIQGDLPSASPKESPKP
jgi:hypothetical protein